MRIVRGLICGMVLVVPPTMQAQTAPTAEGMQAGSLADAKALAAKGRLDQAIGILNTLAQATPEEAGVERLRGGILYQRDQLAEAEAAFGRAVAQDPADRESVQMRGVTLYRLGRAAEAIPLLEQVVAEPVAGANVEPRYVLGLCYTDTKRYDDARKAFAAEFGFEGDSAEAYLVAARLFLRREFADEAGVFARKALELNPRLPAAHQLLGEVALAKADLPLAESELEAEEKLNPLDWAIYDRLGDAYLRNGDYEKARTALNRAVLLDPNATGPFILLGETLVKMGEPIQGLHYLQRAAAMDPENYVTHNALGQAYRALGQMEDANRELKMAVAIQHKGDLR